MTTRRPRPATRSFVDPDDTPPSERGLHVSYSSKEATALHCGLCPRCQSFLTATKSGYFCEPCNGPLYPPQVVYTLHKE